MAIACKYITRTVIGQYSGPDFPVMPTGIMNSGSQGRSQYEAN